MGGKKRVAVFARLEDLQRSARIGRRPPELLELVVRPVEEEHHLVELILPRRDDFIQPVLLAELLEFGIVERVELESLGVIALDEREHVDLLHGGLASAEIEGRAFLEILGREREQQCDHGLSLYSSYVDRSGFAAGGVGYTDSTTIRRETMITRRD